MGRLVLLLIRGYQMAISPLLPRRCRFYPTCSEYAFQAISRHGLAKGGWLAARRLAKCGPWHPGGYDPVPPPKSSLSRERNGAGGPEPQGGN